jgi:hypothetical protein
MEGYKIKGPCISIMPQMNSLQKKCQTDFLYSKYPGKWNLFSTLQGIWYLPPANIHDVMRFSFFLFLLFLSFQAWAQTPCENLPLHFSSKEEAIQTVIHAKFSLNEQYNSAKSSWIRAASYLSCDQKTGYFIFSTADKVYIHKGVPLELWNGFKNASDPGKYYKKYIKNKFLLVLY